MSGRKWPVWLRPHSARESPTAFRLFLGALSGAALSLSFTGSAHSFFSWFSVGLLLIGIFAARPFVAFSCGFVHALLFVVTSLPWIATVLSVHGGVSLLGGWGLVLLIGAAWGVLTGTFTWAANRLAARSIALGCVGAPFVWVALEFVRTHLPEIGFPWNLLGYPASANLAMVQMTAVTGIFGLSFLVAAFNALFAWAYVSTKSGAGRRVTIFLVTAAAIAGMAYIAPQFVPTPQAAHRARAVQLNFPEVESYGEDWFQHNAAALDEIEQLSLARGAVSPDLLVWPEAPAPFSFEDSRFAKRASSLAIRFGNPFLAGVIEWKPAPGSRTGGAPAPYNSALVVNAQGQVIFGYDKIHLVPFGEYEPFPLIHRVVTSVSDEVGGFRKGAPAYAVGALPNQKKFGVFICYEAIFPDEVRRFTANGAQVLVNISNDGWFGRSAAAEQHVRMARVRAVENRRWLIRATNNGFTVSVDPYGRIFSPLAPDVRAAADLPYDFRTDETIYSQYGDWFAWLCVAVSAILLAATYVTKGNAALQSGATGKRT